MKLINDKLVLSVHDISAGGLILALAEMSLSSGYGVSIDKPKNLSSLVEYYFSEDQGRYLVEVKAGNLNKICKILNKDNIFNEKVGTVQKDFFEVPGEFKIDINDLYKTNNTWYNNF